MGLTPQIAPSMLSSDFANLAAEAKRMIDCGADWLHMDVMVCAWRDDAVEASVLTRITFCLCPMWLAFRATHSSCIHPSIHPSIHSSCSSMPTVRPFTHHVLACIQVVLRAPCDSQSACGPNHGLPSRDHLHLFVLEQRYPYILTIRLYSSPPLPLCLCFAPCLPSLHPYPPLAGWLAGSCLHLTAALCPHNQDG